MSRQAVRSERRNQDMEDTSSKRAPAKDAPAEDAKGKEAAGKDGAKKDEAGAPAQPRPRRFARYRYDVRLQVAVFRDGDTTRLWGRTNEMGQDGIGATLTGELKAGEVVTVEFPIPIAPLVMKLRAIVRYSEGLRCGFEFLVVTNEQRETMRKLCEALANAS